MQILSFQKTDIESLVHLQPTGWKDIRPNFEFYCNSLHFCKPIKVVQNNEIVGVGCTIFHDDVAWLGHIIVHPNHRQKGIGQFITKTLIDIAFVSCSTINLIATDMGAPVYEKLGFTTITNYLFFENIQIPNQNISISNIVSYQPQFYEQVLKLDKICSSENRIYLYKDYLTKGLVYLDNEEVKGFYLPEFGEGLLIANNFEAGISLLKYHLNNKSNIIVFPEDNLLLQNFLHSLGYKPYRMAKRMMLGNTRVLNLEMMFGRIAGNIG